MYTFILILSLLFSGLTYAMDVPGPEGVTLELDDEAPHKLIRLRAIGESAIPLGDRKDVQRATKIATLKAKAAISKYLNEDIKTEEVVEQISESIQQSDGQVSTASRHDVERLVETIRDSSSAFMKGVIVLEQNVDQTNKRVIVTIGTSEKSQQAADQARRSLNTDSSYHSFNSKRQTAEIEPDAAGNEIRQNSNRDDF
jgi:hypothetical protein